MERRNVVLLETAPYVLLLQDEEIDHMETDYTQRDAYINGVIHHTSFPYSFVFGLSGETPDQEITRLRYQTRVQHRQ